MSRPIVAVVPVRLAAGRVTGWTDSAEAVPSQYLDGLRRAGTLPVVVGGPPGVDAGELLAAFAGLVLVGGADVEPARYGATAHPAVYGLDPERDRVELEVARAALAGGVPMFAICRGIQVLNVALGGTLSQHLPDLGTGIAHGVPVGAGEPTLHPVTVVPGSRLAAAVGGATTIASCVSIHHQAIDTLAPGLVVTARSADGLVEAVETPAGGPWCLAVQWHPERSAATDPAEQALFDAFATVAEAQAP